MIKQALETLLRSSRGHGFSAAAISGTLSDCITRFDHSITNDFTRIFPGGPAALQGMSSTQIRHLFQDRMSGGPGSQDLTAVTRCLQGSTAIVTLTDPSKHNLWIANLGDSQAGMFYWSQNPVRRVLNPASSSYLSLLFFFFPFSFQNALFSSCRSFTRGRLVRNIRNGAS